MSGPKRDERGQIQRAQPTADTGDSSLVKFLTVDLKQPIKDALPKHLDADRMARIALTALRTIPDLGRCDKYSFGACLLSAAQLGLEVNTPLGHAYLIPRYSRVAKSDERAWQCTLQLGYQGQLELVRRSKLVTSVWADVVYEGDTFRVTKGLHPDLIHEPAVNGDEDPAKITHAYACAKMADGDTQFAVVTRAAIDARRKIGDPKGYSSAWKEFYASMARKTAFRALFTWLPKSPELAMAGAVENAGEGYGRLPDAIDPNHAVLLAQHAGSAIDVDGEDAGENVDDDGVVTSQTPTDEALGYVLRARDADALLATIEANARDLYAGGADVWGAVEEAAKKLEVTPAQAKAALTRGVKG